MVVSVEAKILNRYHTVLLLQEPLISMMSILSTVIPKLRISTQTSQRVASSLLTGKMSDSRLGPDETLSHVRSIWDKMKPNSPIYKFLLEDIKIERATNGKIIAYLPVQLVHLNSKGTLHGTVTACLTDWAGGMAIASTGVDKIGVSTDIHNTFTSTAEAGDLLEIESVASKVGRTLAFTTVEIRKIDEENKRTVVSTGTHTKYVK